jgi:large subunit ribosomal protein L6
MSKIGKTPIQLNSNVKIETTGSKWIITGPKGKYEMDAIKGVDLNFEENVVTLSVKDENAPDIFAFWGLGRALLNNAVKGVTEGFKKELELVGVGYRVEKQGENLRFAIGYSHPVVVKPPVGISFEVEGNTIVKVLGIDKQVVGQMAANIRAIRKPEPYKGKGIKYKNEVVRRKQGKVSK